MKPYFQDSAVTIYCGDCMDILPHLCHFDLLLTDPPYGVSGIQNSKSSFKKNEYGFFIDSFESVRDSVIPAVQFALSICSRAIITPGNRCFTLYPPPDSFGSFFQPASIGLQPWGRADSQPILYYGKFPRESRELPSSSCSFQLTEQPERNGHPCVKPYKAWLKLLSKGANRGESILDPFAGSGTTGRTAKDLGMKAVLIEIEEKYCEIAANRMAQEVLNF